MALAGAHLPDTQLTDAHSASVAQASPVAPRATHVLLVESHDARAGHSAGSVHGSPTATIATQLPPTHTAAPAHSCCWVQGAPMAFCVAQVFDV